MTPRPMTLRQAWRRAAPSLVSACLLAAPLSLGGCLAQEDKGVGRRFDDESTPRCYERARFLEERALKAIRNANDPRWSERRRRELYDDALIDLRDARDMYEEELRENPGPPGREEILNEEFDRLSQTIEDTHRERPPDPVR